MNTIEQNRQLAFDALVKAHVDGRKAAKQVVWDEEGNACSCVIIAESAGVRVSRDLRFSIGIYDWISNFLEMHYGHVTNANDNGQTVTMSHDRLVPAGDLLYDGYLGAAEMLMGYDAVEEAIKIAQEAAELQSV